MNDIDRACAAFRALLAEQQARVAGIFVSETISFRVYPCLF